MRTRPIKLLSILAILTCLSGSAFGQLIPRKTNTPEYREFTSANGKVIKALLIDKTDDTLTLKLPNGKSATLSYDKLSEADQEYVKKWDKEKELFLGQCKTLTIRELLEIRGYESFKFTIKGNHIFVDGELNGNKSQFMIDTGAHSTILHIESAKAKGCKVGPLDQVINGIGGDAPAANTEVPEIRLGQAFIKDQVLLSADLFKDIPGARKDHDAILGAEFMTRMRAVISYKEGRIFFRPDLLNEEGEAKAVEVPEYRFFKTKDRKTYKGKVAKKNATSVELKIEGNNKPLVLPVSRLTDDDAKYVSAWSPEREIFLRQCGGLAVQDILELRKYQSFEYKRRGNHIFVDGELNKKETRFMIDTGAGSSVLHVDWAKECGCQVGPMDQTVYGIGGKAPAAITQVPSLKMGRALFENRRLLSIDLFKQLGGNREYGAIFGADFMRETDAVITYREKKIFLQPDA
ncbi:MAG: clan AA aspartic protease [Verrucomicrobiaceae bacterium]|nr:clan AA aspartic protease [Verrucomicrobiaceae bacterium]